MVRKMHVAMARAMRLAVEAGRLGFLAGRIPRKRYAAASSPLETFQLSISSKRRNALDAALPESGRADSKRARYTAKSRAW